MRLGSGASIGLFTGRSLSGSTWGRHSLSNGGSISISVSSLCSSSFLRCLLTLLLELGEPGCLLLGLLSCLSRFLFIILLLFLGLTILLLGILLLLGTLSLPIQVSLLDALFKGETLGLFALLLLKQGPFSFLTSLLDGKFAGESKHLRCFAFVSGSRSRSRSLT